jgi:hypothetical protein
MRGSWLRRFGLEHIQACYRPRIVGYIQHRNPLGGLRRNAIEDRVDEIRPLRVDHHAAEPLRQIIQHTASQQHRLADTAGTNNRHVMPGRLSRYRYRPLPMHIVADEQPTALWSGTRFVACRGF